MVGRSRLWNAIFVIIPFDVKCHGHQTSFLMFHFAKAWHVRTIITHTDTHKTQKRTSSGLYANLADLPKRKHVRESFNKATMDWFYSSLGIKLVFEDDHPGEHYSTSGRTYILKALKTNDAKSFEKNFIFKKVCRFVNAVILKMYSFKLSQSIKQLRSQIMRHIGKLLPLITIV